MDLVARAPSLVDHDHDGGWRGWQRRSGSRGAGADRGRVQRHAQARSGYECVDPAGIDHLVSHRSSAAVLQLGRNFGAELLAQKMERTVRDELYLSLLAKSMTFHNLQPVGDTMARSTNDVREVNYMFSPGINLVVGSLIFLLMPIFVAGRYHPALDHYADRFYPPVFCVSWSLSENPCADHR